MTKREFKIKLKKFHKDKIKCISRIDIYVDKEDFCKLKKLYPKSMCMFKTRELTEKGFDNFIMFAENIISYNTNVLARPMGVNIVLNKNN